MTYQAAGAGQRPSRGVRMRLQIGGERGIDLYEASKVTTTCQTSGAGQRSSRGVRTRLQELIITYRATGAGRMPK